MPSRSVTWRGYSLQLTTPPRKTSAHDKGAQVGSLIFKNPPPQPKFHRRSIEKALAFRNVAADKGREQADIRGIVGDDDLSRKVRSIAWYHTIELPGGIVTPGQFDHRELVQNYGFPASLEGKRALDVATFNGFWAFHMESLGAEVVAIDLDDPRDWDFPEPVAKELRATESGEERIGSGFEVAHEALGSKVRRIGRSVYDLDPETDGTFDFVHCGDVLVHLRDPLRALERIRAVTTGELLLSDGIDLVPRGGSWGPPIQYLGGWDDVVWWVPSLDALAQLVIDAGFRDVKVNTVYNLAKTYETSGFWRASLTAVV